MFLIASLIALTMVVSSSGFAVRGATASPLFNKTVMEAGALDILSLLIGHNAWARLSLKFFFCRMWTLCLVCEDHPRLGLLNCIAGSPHAPGVAHAEGSCRWCCNCFSAVTCCLLPILHSSENNLPVIIP